MPTSTPPSPKSGRNGLLAVIDTSVWISGAISSTGPTANVVNALKQRLFTPVVCPETLRELTTVLHRPRLTGRYHLSVDSVIALVNLITASSLQVVDPAVIPISRDPSDDIFVAVAVAARADYLVTRDDDLKGDPSVIAHLSEFGCEVVSVRTFIERLAR